VIFEDRDVQARWRVQPGVERVPRRADRRCHQGRAGVRPLHDAFWGERTGQFIDPFGHRWAVDQHLRDVPPAEVARRAAEAFAAGQEG
jgi:hypothetical protein